MDHLKNPVPVTTQGQCDLAEHDRKDFDVGLHTLWRNWIERGKKIPLYEVAYWICYTISLHFPTEESWTKLASKLYVERQPTLLEIQQIQAEADAHKQWPSLIYLLKCWNEPNLSFSAVLTVLYEKLKHSQCLTALYNQGYVEEFLNWREKQVQNNPQYQESGHLENTTLRKKLQLIETLKLTNEKCNTNKDVVCKRVSNQMLMQNSRHEPAGTGHESPKTFPGRKVIIILTYSADINGEIPELVQKFWSAGFGVVAEYVLKGKGYLETNPRDFWENCFKQCNFVVPVVSSQYLKDIKVPSNSEQAIWVRFIYDLYTTKYVTDYSKNFKVRPIEMDGVQEKYLQNLNLTLTYRWRLHQLVEFIDMLKYRCRFEPSRK